MISKNNTGTVGSLDQHKDNLYRMVQYCENRADCRRVQLLDYLGDSHFHAAQCRETCDNCQQKTRMRLENVTDIARRVVMFARSVEGSRDKFTLPHFVDVFRGSTSQKVCTMYDMVCMKK